METHDVIILGAGASGLWCAMVAAGQGLKVAVIDHGPKAARKVRVSGGGKCNFTNLHVTPANYICHNPHFVKSALARLSPWDVIGFLAEHGITYEEREHGQLFTDQGAGKVAGALLERCNRLGVDILLNREIRKVSGAGSFSVDTAGESLSCGKLVLALGGPSWPQVGATDLGFRLAKQFGLKLVTPHPGLVPLVFPKKQQPMCVEMAGNALPVTVETGGMRFTDPLLFTHKGISGPAILQVSSYWRENRPVVIDFLPGQSIHDVVEENRGSNAQLRNLLARILPKRLPGLILEQAMADTVVSQLSRQQMEILENRIHRFTVTPAGTEGYAKAEVCVGGVDTDQISSKTMECRNVPGLFVTGESLDVTGHLGGFNLHWAFASGAACGHGLA
ncbi:MULTISPECIES: NAD(P)/FAD-dependent oxidoreductase [unclassified Pseudodesulfovibrio]|uniref:NAD(P)/FAD-dependent oxidoreductase n=1 Tax=unclassified Pseudodesulfovibrio TaxID=2661612 RepID=UPI000FEB6BE8|nr:MULTISPECIES: NAD(P)/FAD-dependent oxidoreductase [unclassified Pseudodesulfovibrio]MCJ2165705.1 NAD(P)/FAD-dependent oxidoreductase [Pseudodesulfovibrio sp. S3-i]RWU02966.1 NAD(P)/FAD-dependent oxidoreductase [Pseudodesulfovibrio sp. S3]